MFDPSNHIYHLLIQTFLALHYTSLQKWHKRDDYSVLLRSEGPLTRLLYLMLWDREGAGPGVNLPLDMIRGGNSCGKQRYTSVRWRINTMNVINLDKKDQLGHSITLLGFIHFICYIFDPVKWQFYKIFRCSYIFRKLLYYYYLVRRKKILKKDQCTLTVANKTFPHTSTPLFCKIE